jgi:hypothetical protein
LCLPDDESRIKLFELMKPTNDSSAFAKINESWVTYTVNVDDNISSNRLGRLRSIVTNLALFPLSLAIINAYNVTQELDLGLNPILEDARHWDVVDVTDVKMVVNVQHMCTLNCIPVLQGGNRRDLRSLTVPKSAIVHDVTVTQYILNKHRLK